LAGKCTDFIGPKTFEEWADVYERRAGDDVHFQLDPREQIFFNPEYGFFTYWVDHWKGRLVIPKMVGNGKYLRHVIFEMVKQLEPLGFREILCCSRRRPEVYLRVLGGRFDHVEETVNINTGKKEPLYYYVVSLDDTKEAQKSDVIQEDKP
jgi:hypothetical protein